MNDDDNELNPHALISMDPGVNGAFVVWISDKTRTPITYSWSRNGRADWEIIKNIWKILEKCIDEFDIKVMVVERPWGGAIHGGQFQAVLFDDMKRLAEKKGITFKFVAPTSVKAKVTGNGRASKEQVQRAVNKFFADQRREQPKMSNEHEYDAVAVGIAYWRRRS